MTWTVRRSRSKLCRKLGNKLCRRSRVSCVETREVDGVENWEQRRRSGNLTAMIATRWGWDRRGWGCDRRSWGWDRRSWGWDRRSWLAPPPAKRERQMKRKGSLTSTSGIAGEMWGVTIWWGEGVEGEEKKRRGLRAIGFVHGISDCVYTILGLSSYVLTLSN